MKVQSPKWRDPLSEGDMIEMFDVDVDKWEWTKLKHNVWPTTMKGEDGNAYQIDNYQTTLFLNRIYPEYLEETESIIAKLLKSQWPEVGDIEVDTTNNLGSIFWPDVHLDKRDTKWTTIKQKQKKILLAVQKLYGKLETMNPEAISLNVLGDFFNTHSNNQTTKWTPQQNMVWDISWRESGIELNIQALEWLSQQVPVVARYLRGNHESEKINYLQDVLKYYFDNNDNVRISMSRNEVQTYKWGKNVIWLHHWDKVSSKDLMLMILKYAWVNAEFVEAYTWHRHKNITESHQWALYHVLWAVWSINEWSKRNWVDHANNEMWWSIHNKKEWKIAMMRQTV